MTTIPLSKKLFLDRNASSVVEFALVAPVLLFFWLGATDLSFAVTVSRKIEAAAGAMADLASRSSNLEQKELRSLLSASLALMSPYKKSALRARLMAIRVDDKGKALVAWSCQTTGFARLDTDTPATLPSDMVDIRDRFVIRTETTYQYRPALGFLGLTDFNIGAVSYTYPRYSDTITSPSNGCDPIAF